MSNRYNLDAELTREQDEDYWDKTSVNLRIGARRCREYWNVFDRNKGINFAKDKLNEAYKLDEYALDFMDEDTWAFVTDDVDLASELIRVLELDFVHDFKTGLFFFDIFAFHEILMSYLYEGISGKSTGSFDDGAELYVHKGYGCYNSSQSRKIWLGEDVAAPTYLSQFKNKFMRM